MCVCVYVCVVIISQNITGLQTITTHSLVNGATFKKEITGREREKEKEKERERERERKKREKKIYNRTINRFEMLQRKKSAREKKSRFQPSFCG